MLKICKSTRFLPKFCLCTSIFPAHPPTSLNLKFYIPVDGKFIYLWMESLYTCRWRICIECIKIVFCGYKSLKITRLQNFLWRKGLSSDVTFLDTIVLCYGAILGVMGSSKISLDPTYVDIQICFWMSSSI